MLTFASPSHLPTSRAKGASAVLAFALSFCASPIAGKRQTSAITPEIILTSPAQQGTRTIPPSPARSVKIHADTQEPEGFSSCSPPLPQLLQAHLYRRD